MIVFDPHQQFAFAQAGLQALAVLGLGGAADRLAAFVEEDAVAAAEGRQRADHFEHLHLGLELLAAILEGFAHGPWQALGEVVEALLEQGQGAAGVLRSQAGVKAGQALAALVEPLFEGAAQAHVQVIQALGLLAQAFAGMAQASGQAVEAQAVVGQAALDPQ